MDKKFTNEDVDYQLEEFNKNNLHVYFLMLIGYVTETIDDHNDTMKMFPRWQKYVATGTRQVYAIEVESTNTFEMVKNLKKFINISDGPLLLATDPMHHRRTILVLKKQNFDVLIPDNYIRNIETSYSAIPSIKGIGSFNEIIHESLGIIWYYFTGKI